MPSTSKKQQRFMGAQLSKQRKTGSNSTGMSEEQLREFAGSRVSKAKHQKDGRSLVDVEFHTRKPEEGTLTLQGFLYQPGEECHDAQKHHEFLASWESRNIDKYKDYGAPVMFLGPDSDFRAEEVNPHHYGRDYEPAPLKDLFKTEDKAEELGIRMREEYEYAELATPGSVAKKGLESSLAYGTTSYSKIKTEMPDNRSFDSQQEFRRQHDELDEDMPENKPKVKMYRHR